MKHGHARYLVTEFEIDANHQATIWSRHPQREVFLIMRISLLICCALALAGCSAGGNSAAPPPQPISSTSSPAATLPSTTTTTAPNDSPESNDQLVCASLETNGKPFYESTYSEIMRKQRTAVQPTTLSAQLAALATTGAPAGSTDGTAGIMKASPTVREKLTIMVRDADRLAQRYADAATGAVVGSDITAIINSFTDALVACTKAGYQPSWFDPATLLGH